MLKLQKVFVSCLLAFSFNAATWKSFCEKTFPAKLSTWAQRMAFHVFNPAKGYNPVWDLQSGVVFTGVSGICSSVPLPLHVMMCLLGLWRKEEA